MFLCGVAGAQDVPSRPWVLQWPYRVQIDCPPGAGETAEVEVALAGRTTEQGNDLRLLDAQGNQQPFEIIFLDPKLRALLAFKVADGKPATFWLYFGNMHAGRIIPVQPDPSHWAWQPCAGVLLRVYRKAKPQCPKTLAEFQAMLRAGTLQGAGFVGDISQGHNLFGPSDQYMSVYQAWLHIDTPGTYSFCTASADGSWINVNDQPLVQSPGPHGWGGMERGEVNGSIELRKGLAKIDYYQEAGGDAHMAFLGWKPPGQDRFTMVSSGQWAQIRRATASAYESRDKPIIAVPDVRLVSTYWLPDSSDRQTTLLRATDRSASRAGRLISAAWDFGDGQRALGQRQEHVYFRLGRPTILLTVSDSAGNSDSISCQPNIFLEDVQAPDVAFGRPDMYAQIASRYDTEKMPQSDLSLYAQFWQSLERWNQFASAAKAYVRRFADFPDSAQLAAAAADACADAQAYDPASADQLYRLAIKPLPDADARRTLTFHLAKNLAWNLGRLDDAKAIYRQLIQSAGSDMATVRNATIGLGDVEMLGGNLPAAKEQYRAAEQLSDRKSLDQSVELAKLGSYPWTVEDYLDRGDYDEAIDALNQWEYQYPLQKLDGASLLLRGKVLFVRQPCEPALKFLQLAETVNPAGTQAPEAVWLRANCLMSLGRNQQAIEQFARVETEFTRSEFAARAKEKIAECEQRLKSSASSPR